MALDRFKLNDALSPFDQNSQCLNGWGQEIHPFFKVDSVVTRNFGFFEVPFTKEKIDSIFNKHKGSSDIANEHVGWCNITAENIIEFHSSSPQKNISQLIEHAFREKFGPGLENTRINVDVHIKSLIICQPSSSFVINPALGAVLLQLPVEPESGLSANVSIHYNGEKKKSLDYEQKPPSYVTFVTGNSDAVKPAEVAIQPVGKDPSVFLVFNLSWPDYFRLAEVPVSDCTTMFSCLDKLKEAKQALVGWENIDVKKLQVSENSANSGLSSKTAILDAQGTSVLCIPMRHSYCIYEFQMGYFHPEDNCMVDILKTVQHIDVNIVVLAIEERENSVRKGLVSRATFDMDGTQRDTRQANPIIDWKKEAASTEGKTFAVHTYVQGDWNFPDVHKQFSCLRFDRHLVGDITSVMVSYNEDWVSFETRERSSRSITYHPAILIRPRKAAISDCWKSCPTWTVECLTQRLKQGLRCHFSEEALGRHLLLDEVNLISSWIDEEGRVDGCEKATLLYRLLNIYVHLEEVDSGLKIMALISATQCNCRQYHPDGFDADEIFIVAHCVLEGFKRRLREKNRETGVDDIIIGLVRLVGWERCSNFVHSIYSRYELIDYRLLCNLSKRLNEIGYVHGAIYFANACLRILTGQDSYTYEIKRKDLSEDVDYYVDLSLTDTSNIDQERQEMFELLGKISTKDPDLFNAVIARYIHNLNHGIEELLDDLKLTVSTFISQMRSYKDPRIMFRVIRFVHRTQNAPLANMVWSKLTSPDFDNKGTHFERFLTDYSSYADFADVGCLYKAIARSPLATEHFYKFIDEGKMKTDDSRLCEASLFHLTMAEKEQSLATEQTLQSLLSSLNEASLDSLMGVAEAIVRHNASTPGLQISLTIVSTLLRRLPIADLASLMFQETDDFRTVMYCYIHLGDNAAKLELLQTLKEALLPRNSEELNLIGNQPDVLLVQAWLACLKLQLDEDSNSTGVAYQILNFFHVFLALDPEVGDLGELWSQVKFEFFEKLLIALYEREYRRAPKCLKASAAGLKHWELSQHISEGLTMDPEMTAALINFEPERITKLLFCIFWLGVENAIENFVRLVCDVLPFEKARYCLSLFITSNDELQACALSSSYAFKGLRRLVRHCISQLFAHEECSWSRQGVTIDCYPEVAAFYQSEEKSKTFGPFDTTHEASCFIVYATEGLPWIEAEVRFNETGESFLWEVSKLYPADFDAAFSNETSLWKIWRTSSGHRYAARCDDLCESKCTICSSSCFKAQRSEDQVMNCCPYIDFS